MARSIRTGWPAAVTDTGRCLTGLASTLSVTADLTPRGPRPFH